MENRYGYVIFFFTQKKLIFRFYSEEIAFPILLQTSLNINLKLHQKLVKIDLVFHYDAVNCETMVQFKAINPRGITFFHQYGCSTPVVICGWAHKENNLEKLGIGVIEDILKAIQKPYRIPQLPNTLIKLNWEFATGLLKKNLIC